MLLRENLIDEEINQRLTFSNRNGNHLTNNYKSIVKAITLIFCWFVSKLIYFTITYYPELFTRKNGIFLEKIMLYQSIVELFAFLAACLLIRFTIKRIYILVFSFFILVISIFGELLFYRLNYFEESMHNYYSKLIFLLMIKFSISLITQFLLLFTGECYHTNLHPKIYGYSLSFSFIGGMTASFVPLFINFYNLTITLILLGLLSILNLFLFIWLPDVSSPHDSIQKLNLDPKRPSDLTNDESFDLSFKIEE